MSRHNKIEPRCISLPETRILIKSVTDGRHRLGLALMACAGLRVSEICLLKVKDLHPELSSMRVTGKGGRERIVPLSPFLAERDRGSISAGMARRSAMNQPLWAAPGAPGIT